MLKSHVASCTAVNATFNDRRCCEPDGPIPATPQADAASYFVVNAPLTMDDTVNPEVRFRKERRAFCKRDAN